MKFESILLKKTNINYVSITFVKKLITEDFSLESQNYNGFFTYNFHNKYFFVLVLLKKHFFTERICNGFTLLLVRGDIICYNFYKYSSNEKATSFSNSDPLT